MKGCLKTVLIIFVCFIVLTIGIGIGVSMMGDGADTSNPPSGTQGTNQENVTKAPPKNTKYITLAEFEAIKSGMTYEEVVEIVGGEGTLNSEADLGVGEEYRTQIYSWEGEGVFSSGNATVSFQGGKVVAKSQFGLD